MKRFLFVFAALCLLVWPSGCARETPAPAPQEADFFSFFEDAEITAFAAHFDAEKPVSVSYTFNAEAAGEAAVLTDTDAITAVFEALRVISVTGEADEISTDNEHLLQFTCRNGKTVLFVFNGHQLAYNGRVYTIEQDAALWELIGRLFV